MPVPQPSGNRVDPRPARVAASRPAADLADARLHRAVLSRIVAAEAARDPDRLVYVFENGPHQPERVTAADLATGGNRLAGAFRTAGLQRGERVAVMLRNHPEFLYTLVAATRLALPAVPVDPGSRNGVLAVTLTGAGCAALVTADYLVADPAVADAIRNAGLHPWVLSTPEGRAAGLDLSREYRILNEILAGPDAPEPGERVTSPTELWLRLPDPGANGGLGTVDIRYDQMPSLVGIPRLLGYHHEDVLYTGVSLAHPDALVTATLPPLTGAAQRAVLSRRFSPNRVWDICSEFGATIWSSGPTMATAVYGQPTSERDRAHGVRLVLSAAMPKEIWRAFEARFGTEVVEWDGRTDGAVAGHPADSTAADRAVDDGFVRRTVAEDPEVIDVHVYAVPLRGRGSRRNDTVAAVVVRDRSSFEPDRFFSRLADRLDGAAVPDVLQVVDELPRTAAEKVQTRVLSAVLADAGSVVFRRNRV